MCKFLFPMLAFFLLSAEVSAQCAPQLLNCNAAIDACDYTVNDPFYWNEVNWWDNANQSHDLAESKVDLSLEVKDLCAGDSLSVRALLFLDLNGDGVQETVVDSDNPPAAGMVNFDNAANPNYSGGTPRAFDQRPLPTTQDWQFALKTNTQGDTLSYSLLWTNQAAPTSFVQPQLAYGVHKIRWLITNKAGVTFTCEKSFQTKDCKAPTVVCLNGLSVNVMPTAMITLWDTDFLQYTEDNVTPSPLLKLGVRKSGTGVGFPVDANGNPVANVTFDCSEIGTQAVELWAIDATGNADYCETYVIVQDNLGVCGDPPVAIQACAKGGCDDISDEIAFNFTVIDTFLPPFSYFDIGNCASFNQALPGNTNVIISPSLDDNPLNGVSSYDLVLLQQYIDGIGTLASPYAWIAADANNDQVIDSLDILTCKNLILGIYTELPNNTSWRFVDKSYVFPSPNPLSAPFPESITVNTSNLPSIPVEFVGVKICDISCGYLVGFFEQQAEQQSLIGLPEPNPTNAGAMIPVQLIKGESVQLEVLDYSGRLLFSREMDLPAGPAMFEIPATALENAGIYVWRMRAGTIQKSGKIVRY